MAAVMEINSTVIRSVAPFWMGETGKIKPAPPAVLRKDGLGRDIIAPSRIFTWTWDELLIADFTWWTLTILGAGVYSAVYAQAKLYDHNGVLTTYANAVLHAPTFDGISGDTYLNVSITIDGLLLP